MLSKTIPLITHKTSISVGGILRYRVSLLPSQVSFINTIQFRVHNDSPYIKNIASGGGPWKIAIALVRNPDNKTPKVPELMPMMSSGKTWRFDAKVNHLTSAEEQEEGSNNWELEVLSEMVGENQWINVKVEVFAVFSKSGAQLIAAPTGPAVAVAADSVELAKAVPLVLQPGIVSCEYKDTWAICGPKYPDSNPADADTDKGYHLILLSHGVRGSWLDMLYIKEQIDVHNKDNKTITFLTSANHAGTQEGLQRNGQRAAMDILELTGYCDTPEGLPLRKAFAASPARARPFATPEVYTTSTAGQHKGVFPRGFSKISVIGHSLGGLINIYALGFIEDVTQGAFFKKVQPVHYIAMASPLLGIGFEQSWFLKYLLARGFLGQTGTDLSVEDRGPTSTSSSPPSKKKNTQSGLPPLIIAIDTSLETDTTSPLMVTMSRPGSVCSRILKQFLNRVTYTNIENDHAVRFMTSSMMGISGFDEKAFLAKEPSMRKENQKRFPLLSGIWEMMFPEVPGRERFLEVGQGRHPIVVVDKALSASFKSAPKTAAVTDDVVAGLDINGTGSPKSTMSTPRTTLRSASDASTSMQTSSSDLAPKTQAGLAQVISNGYHAEMDWTKIGVFLEDREAHTEVIVRRKWYNLDGWKSVKDLVERFDFS
ncbi:hypothetical protein EC991_010378 [Linnemannia zychae]|nr:hypothetical protein EC991_010378 [Linnemannia zychae]